MTQPNIPFISVDDYTWQGNGDLGNYFVEVTDGGHRDRSDRLAVFWRGELLSYQIGCAPNLGAAARMARKDAEVRYSSATLA